MSAPLCSIVIVNYNTCRLLLQCLASIMRAEDAGQLEIIVVDNGSRDGSADQVRSSYPAVRLIENRENLGFSKANNQGIALSGCEAVLLLNSDTTVLPGSVGAMLRFLVDHPAVGIIGPKVLNSDLTTQATGRSFPRPINAFFGRRSLLSRIFPGNRLSRRYLACLAPRDLQAPWYQVDWVSGACMMIRRAVLDQVGLLDEGYFIYWEDADLCCRAKKGGWLVAYLNSGTVIHHDGKSLSSGNIVLRNRLTREFHRSAYRYYCKHGSSSRFAVTRALAFLGLGARTWATLLRNNIRHYLFQGRHPEKPELSADQI